jgi:MFS family permease
LSRRPRVFYGWWVVSTAALGLLLGSAPIVVFSFPVFLRALSQEFHYGRGSISLAFTFHNGMSALSLLWAGRLVDRYGARKVILPYTTIFGLVLLSSKVLSGKMWQLYVFYMALGLVGCAAAPMPYSDVVSHWFDRHRGLALGLMMFGLGFGAMIMPSVAQRLIVLFGWRTAYTIFGSLVLIVSVPVVAAFLKEKPGQMNLLPDGAGATTAMLAVDANQGLRWREAWHTRTFWMMLCAFFLVSASVQGCMIHMAAILADRGSTAQAAALASSLVGGALMLGRVGSGYLLDHFFGPKIAGFFFGGAALGIGMLWASSAREIAFVAAFLVGLGLGAEADIMAFLTSRYFGLRSFGEIYSYIWAAFALAGAIGAYLMGVGFDVKGSYTLPLGWFFVATVIAVLLMTRLGPYQYCASPLNESAQE